MANETATPVLESQNRLKVNFMDFGADELMMSIVLYTESKMAFWKFYPVEVTMTMTESVYIFMISYRIERNSINGSDQYKYSNGEKSKKQAENLFLELGMNMITAFIMFVRQSVRHGKIPFEISLNRPNA